jgi:hypothetical protein
VNNHHSQNPQDPRRSEAKRDPSDEAERLQHDIEAIRDNLGGLIGELDHRRHEALNLRLQLRRHALPVTIGALAILGLVATGIAVRVARNRRRERLPARLRRLRHAVARMIDDPDHVAEGRPKVGTKILTAGGTAGAAVVARRLAERLIRR